MYCPLKYLFHVVANFHVDQCTAMCYLSYLSANSHDQSWTKWNHTKCEIGNTALPHEIQTQLIFLISIDVQQHLLSALVRATRTIKIKKILADHHCSSSCHDAGGPLSSIIISSVLLASLLLTRFPFFFVSRASLWCWTLVLSIGGHHHSPSPIFLFIGIACWCHRSTAWLVGKLLHKMVSILAACSTMTMVTSHHHGNNGHWSAWS